MLIYGNEESEFTEIKNLNSDIQEITTGDYLQETTAGEHIQENTHTSVPPVHHKTKVPYQEVIDAFNSICISLPKVQQLTDSRKTAIKKMWKLAGSKRFSGNNMEVLQTLFKKTEASDFLAGRVKEWRANFDWIMTEKKAIQILEGQRDNRQPDSKSKTSFTRIASHNWDLDELEKRASDYMEKTLYADREGR